MVKSFKMKKFVLITVFLTEKTLPNLKQVKLVITKLRLTSCILREKIRLVISKAPKRHCSS